VSERLLRIPEVARRLGIEGTEAYALIERGELVAGKGRPAGVPLGGSPATLRRGPEETKGTS
jgi:predicted DNA-binding transcriptional regulator AlpA